MPPLDLYQLKLDGLARRGADHGRRPSILTVSDRKKRMFARNQKTALFVAAWLASIDIAGVTSVLA